MRRKKICFLVALLITGGSDKLLLAQSAILMKKGFEIVIYSIRPIEKNSLYTEFIEKGINVKDYPLLFKYFLKIFKYALIYPLSLLKMIGFNKTGLIDKLIDVIENGIIARICEPILCLRILIDARKERYDIISASHFSTLRIAHILKKILKITVIYTEISSPKWRRKNLTRKKIGNHLNCLDRIIVPSKIIGKELIQYEGLSKEYVVLPFFIDFPEIEMRFVNRKAEFFGLIARLSSEKNQDVLINVLKLIHEKNVNARLILVGRGPKENDYKNLAKNLRVDKHVKFISHFDDINEVINCIDIFVSCSDVEGMSLSLIEALYYGKPILATDVGANAELVLNNFNGYLIDKNDINDIAMKIINIIENEDIFKKFSYNSRILYKELFNNEKLSKQLLEIYTKGQH